MKFAQLLLCAMCECSAAMSIGDHCLHSDLRSCPECTPVSEKSDYTHLR